MTRKTQRVTWSATESTIVGTVADLDHLLDKLAAEHGSDKPITVIIDGPEGESVYHGVGADVSFVSSCKLPYLTTVGDDSALGEVDYYFQGHHSPVAQRNLVSAGQARKIVREFFTTGQLPRWQIWEAIGDHEVDT